MPPYQIKSTERPHGHRRGGRRWGTEPATVADHELGEEQLAACQADPCIEVTYIDGGDQAPGNVMTDDPPEATVTVGGEEIPGTTETTAAEPAEGEVIDGPLFSEAKPADPEQLALEILAGRDLLKEQTSAPEAWLKGKVGVVPELDDLAKVMGYAVTAAERNSALK